MLLHLFLTETSFCTPHIRFSQQTNLVVVTLEIGHFVLRRYYRELCTVCDLCFQYKETTSRQCLIFLSSMLVIFVLNANCAMFACRRANQGRVLSAEASVARDGRRSEPRASAHGIFCGAYHVPSTEEGKNLALLFFLQIRFSQTVVPKS